MTGATGGILRRAASASLLGTIAFYRQAISPWLPARCRFAPSCSQYAAEAIARHGPLAGSRLAAGRIARCHPWHPGGHDPVPPLPTSPVRSAANDPQDDHRHRSRTT